LLKFLVTLPCIRQISYVWIIYETKIDGLLQMVSSWSEKHYTDTERHISLFQIKYLDIIRFRSEYK